MTDFNQDIFNLDPVDFVDKNEKKESELYKPDAKKGTDNVYSSLIRFVAFWKDPKNSKIKKYSYWLEDPLNGEGFSVDCPSSINQKSPLQDAFWKLKKSTNASEVKLSEKFKRKENYYALVQILKDTHQPEMVGKIKVFKFGQKLNAIIQSELQPEYGKPYNPFDPFNGRIMNLKVTLSGGFNNYDLSKFVGDESPITMNGKPITKDPQVMKDFVEWLKTNSPDLTNYEYKEWTDDVRARVKSVIDRTTPTLRTTNEALNTAKSAPISRNVDLNPSPVAESAPSVSVDDLDLDTMDSGAGDDFNDDLYAGL